MQDERKTFIKDCCSMPCVRQSYNILLYMQAGDGGEESMTNVFYDRKPYIPTALSFAQMSAITGWNVIDILDAFTKKEDEKKDE